MKKSFQIKALVAALGFMFLTVSSYAFDIPPKCLPGQTTSAPFDGGISLLIAAGIGYASKKGYDKRQKRNEVQNQEK